MEIIFSLLMNVFGGVLAAFVVIFIQLRFRNKVYKITGDLHEGNVKRFVKTISEGKGLCIDITLSDFFAKQMRAELQFSTINAEERIIFDFTQCVFHSKIDMRSSSKTIVGRFYCNATGFHTGGIFVFKFVELPQNYFDDGFRKVKIRLK